VSVFDEILLECLPVRRARWVATATLLAAGAAFGLPELLEKLDLSLTPPTRLLIRISIPLTLALLGALLVTAMLVRHIHFLSLNKSDRNPRPILHDAANSLPGIVALIAKYQSQEIPATPRKIAGDLGEDQDLILAYMWKYHNEQYITFRNDGRRPELDTAFFLSPKAWEVIRIVEA